MANDERKTTNLPRNVKKQSLNKIFHFFILKLITLRRLNLVKANAQYIKKICIKVYETFG
jgi:hypothetical protein